MLPLLSQLIPSATGAMLSNPDVSIPMCGPGLQDTTQVLGPNNAVLELASLLSHRGNASRDGAGRFLLQSARLMRWDFHHAANLESEKAASNHALK